MHYKHELTYMISAMETRIADIEKELAGMPDGALSTEIRHGKPTYVLNTKDGDKRVRRSLSKEPQMILAILRRESLQSDLKKFQANLAAIKAAADVYQETGGMETISELLEQWPDANDLLAGDSLMDPHGRLWMQQPYKQFSGYPEAKRQRTRNGLAVRSKSELLIAERLYDYHVPFRYEQVLEFGSMTLAPDFTIRRADGKLLYWEHMGIMQQRSYRDNQVHKIQVYADNNIVPWDNLIITFDDASGRVDMREIDSRIRNRILV